MNTPSSRDNTIFLRFLAILFVINSHNDLLYPLPIFATGGAMGNALFFMLSAFGLLMSEQRRPQRFGEYYTKRIIRIYPAVWTSTFFLMVPIALFTYMMHDASSGVIFYEKYLANPLPFIGIFFYPPHWFLQALMFYYFLGFFFIKNYNSKKIFNAYVFFTIIYIIAYMQFTDFSALVIEQTIGFKMIFYGMVFLLGIYFASINDRILYDGKKDFVILISIIILVYIHKYLWLNGITTQLQFIQQLLILPMLYYFMKISKSPLVLDKIMMTKYLSGFITICGAMTLELYIVHGTIRFIFIKNIPGFPENVLLYLSSTFLISYLLYKVNRILIDRIRQAV